jgi:peroxin-1
MMWRISADDIEQGLTQYLTCLRPSSANGEVHGSSTDAAASAEGESTGNGNQALIRRFKEQGLQTTLNSILSSNTKASNKEEESKQALKRIRWKNSVGGYTRVRESLFEVLYYPIVFKRLYEQSPVRLPRAIMLFGPPGCGKTHIAKTIGIELFGNTHVHDLQSLFSSSSSSASTRESSQQAGHVMNELLNESNFYYIKGPQLLNKYIGASEKMIRDLFQSAMKGGGGRGGGVSKCSASQSQSQSQSQKGEGRSKGRAKNQNVLIFFDEFEALAPRRGRDNTGITDRIVNQLLTFIDGVESSLGGSHGQGSNKKKTHQGKGKKNEGSMTMTDDYGEDEYEDDSDEFEESGRSSSNRQIFIMIASSRPDLIDPALLRPGRIEKHVYLGLPTSEDVMQILTTLLKSMAIDDCVPSAIREIARMEKMRQFTVADVKAIVDTAYLIAAHEVIEEEIEQHHRDQFYDSDRDDAGEERDGRRHSRDSASTTVKDPSHPVVIKGDHLLKAFQETRPSLSAEDLHYYESIYTRFRVDQQGNDDLEKDNRRRQLAKGQVEEQKMSYR